MHMQGDPTSFRLIPAGALALASLLLLRPAR
jgi:hypothetical protein